MPGAIDTSGTLLFKQAVDSDVQYSIDSGVNWTNVSSWPVTLNNTDALNSPLTATFITDLSFNSVDQYFIMDSSNITIDGSSNVVYVNVADYPGLLQNGTNSTSGQSNITIQNIGVDSSYSLASDGGWIGQTYFGIGGATNCLVTNCYSTGTISNFAGGIFGTSSQGSATNCYSTGTISQNAGGIFGRDSSGSASGCYSTGTISQNAGGIFGFTAFGYSSQCSATNCYSTGTISGGGIFGAFNKGSATNCYSIGTLAGGKGIGGESTNTYCYFTDGSSNWLDASADASLNVSGNAWTDIDAISTNVPYRLTSFYTPQTLYYPDISNNAVVENPDISGNYTWSITSVNGSTDGQTGISINSSTGDITFDFGSLIVGTYQVNVLAADSFGKYSFETFTNLISNICFPAGTPIVTNQGIIPIQKINPAIHTIRNKKIVAITKTVTPDKYLVRFEKDALGPNLPSEATTMTKNHMLFYRGKMMKANEFLKTHTNSVSKVPYKGQVLYNVLMEEHEKMVVNNLICETLNPENYVAKMYHAFKLLTPQQRTELIKQVNLAALSEDIYNKSTAKRFTFSTFSTF